MTSKKTVLTLLLPRDDETVSLLNAYEEIVARIPGFENDIKRCDLDDLKELNDIISIVSPTQIVCVIDFIPHS
jgi:hypothetical protein